MRFSFSSLLSATLTLSGALAAPVIQERALSSDSLRIQPLGASITVGYLSTKGYGYRKPLQDLLVAAGVNVDFVGSRTEGTNMANNHVEAKNGETIVQIATRFNYSSALRPNIVLIHAGTNDMIQGLQAAAPARINALLEQIHAACPDAVLMVAKLVHPNATTQSTMLQRTIDFNNAVTTIVNTKASLGWKILNPDMTHVSPLQPDGIHPTDAGYAQMANIWMSALQTADANGWISVPVTAYPKNPGGQ